MQFASNAEQVAIEMLVPRVEPAVGVRNHSAYLNASYMPAAEGLQLDDRMPRRPAGPDSSFDELGWPPVQDHRDLNAQCGNFRGNAIAVVLIG